MGDSFDPKIQQADDEFDRHMKLDAAIAERNHYRQMEDEAITKANDALAQLREREQALELIELTAATWNGQDRDNLPAVVEHIARLARLSIESAPPREDSDG